MTGQPTPRGGEMWAITVPVRVYHANERQMLVELVSMGGAFTLPLLHSEYEGERLPDPEPEWRQGDLVLDSNGVVWRRLSGPSEYWTIPGRPGYVAAAGKPARPLRRLVPEVQS